MRIQSVRIKSNDYPQEYKEFAESLGDTINPFIDQLITGLNKNITVDENLPFEFKTLDMVVDGAGTPTINGTLLTALKSFKGYICVNVQNISGSGAYPTGTPFLSTEVVNNTVKIKNITSLPAGVTFRLTLLGIS